MDSSFCVKCRKPTSNLQISTVKTKNNRTMLKSLCGVCGFKKSKFIPTMKGNGVHKFLPVMKKNGVHKFLPVMRGAGPLNFVLNNLPLPEMHLLDPKHKRYNFCGPYTKLHKRVVNGVPVTKPINVLDEGCFHHDLAYEKHKDVPNRNIADAELVKYADRQLQNPNASKVDKFNAGFVKKIMQTKSKFKI